MGFNFCPLNGEYVGQHSTTRDEDEFKAKLKEILSSQATLNVVHSILAQVRA